MLFRSIMSYYKRHLFFCTYQAEDGSEGCGRHGSAALHKYAKQRVQDLGLHGPDQYRINKSSCLGRCSEGPTVVVYPDNVWYTYVDREDIDEIIDEHIINGREVERLKLK